MEWWTGKMWNFSGTQTSVGVQRIIWIQVLGWGIGSDPSELGFNSKLTIENIKWLGVITDKINFQILLFKPIQDPLRNPAIKMKSFQTQFKCFSFHHPLIKWLLIWLWLLDAELWAIQQLSLLNAAIIQLLKLLTASNKYSNPAIFTIDCNCCESFTGIWCYLLSQGWSKSWHSLCIKMIFEVRETFVSTLQ